MSPDNIVATLGYLCGAGRVRVRHGEEWSEIRTSYPTHPSFAEEVVSTTDLFLLLTADEVKF